MRPIPPVTRWYLRRDDNLRTWLDCALVVAFIVFVTWSVGAWTA